MAASGSGAPAFPSLTATRRLARAEKSMVARPERVDPAPLRW
jgi:hypothetical protein